MRSTPKLLTIILAILPFIACNSKSRKLNDDDDRAIRMGEKVEIGDFNSYDTRPDLSADGNRFVFVSGRDEVLRVYTYDLTAGGSPSRLTDTDEKDIIAEDNPRISPDGNWVIFEGISERGRNLYARDFSSAGETILLTDDVEIESDVEFSADSKLFAYTRKAATGAGPRVFLGYVDAINGPSKDVIELASEKVSDERPIFLTSGTAGTYRLASIRRDLKGFSGRFFVHTITLSGSDISVTDSAASFLLSAVNMRSDIPPAARGEGLVLVRYNAQEGEEGYERSRRIAGNTSSQERVSISSYPVFADLAAKKTSELEFEGMATLSVSHTGSLTNDLGLWLVREPFQCDEDKIIFGTGLILANVATGKSQRLVPRYDKELKEFTMGSDYCPSKKELEADTDSNFEFTIAKLNRDATSENYTVVHVTHFFKDHEIYAIQKTGSTSKVHKISKNLPKD